MGFFDRYPYTNWHNVNLDWVLERVKEWGQMVEANNQAFQDLEEANASFKEYVTNYLQNLDIQAQIDDKLDRMFESGELTDYLQPYVSDTVTDWLEENITEPTGVIIDSSLTVSGACADAKVVGDKFGELGVTRDAKSALINCFQHIALWLDDEAQSYIDRLESALYSGVGWDYEWSYNDGFPEDNGMTITNNDGTVSMTSNGLSVSTQNSSTSIVQYKYENVSAFSINKTTAELVFEVTSFTSLSGGGIRLYAGLGSVGGVKRIGQFLFTRDGIKYLSGSSWLSLYEATFSTGVQYTMRIEQTEDRADVYINGNNIGTLTEFTEEVAYPQFTVHRGASAIFKSFRLRFFGQEETS